MGWPGEFLPKAAAGGMSSWEGWFLIAIGRRGQNIRWTKTHAYRNFGRRGTHPLSKLEGMEAPGELVTFVGARDEIRKYSTTFSPEDISCNSKHFELDVPGSACWEGEGPHFHFERHSGEELKINFKLSAWDRLTWLKAPRILTYFGYHSSLDGMLAEHGQCEDFNGLGIVEHAWGRSIPLDPNLFVRGPWHWDVLNFEEVDGEPVTTPAALAALSVPLPIVGSRGVRVQGRFPDGNFARGTRCKIRHQGFGAAGHVRYPIRWSGHLVLGGEELNYEARACTPLAKALATGGFLGFDFEGEWKSAGGRTRQVSGSGFAECGSPGWREQ